MSIIIVYLRKYKLYTSETMKKKIFTAIIAIGMIISGHQQATACTGITHE